MRIFALLTGYGFAVAGGVTFIAYLNLFTVGFSFIKYLGFMASRPEFYLFFLGMGLIFGALYFPDQDGDEKDGENKNL
ncbi:hypothetical protein FGB90_00975 [Alteribacter natronophilus]|nr:hypothetical protein FGB90_00975 [Alteribacter natronophilus]